MNKNLLQKPMYSITKAKLWSKTLTMLLFFTLVGITKTQAQNLAWAKSMGSTSSDYSRSISVDVAGNVYTTGYFQGTVDFDPSAGISNLTSAGAQDIFVTKLDANGNLVWAIAMGGTNTDIGSGISVDAAGNVYTTGYFQVTADFDPSAGISNLTSAGNNDIFVTKLDANGNLVWAKAMGGTNADTGNGISVDAAGNVYTTGYFQGTADFDPNAGVSNLTSAGNNDIFVTKLDANGNLVWAKAMGNTSADTGYGISTDASGNVYTTGFFQGTADFDPNAGIFNLTSAGNNDIFVTKLDANGNLVWAIAMGGTNADIGSGISVDAAGNVYTTGYFQVTADFDPNAGVSNLTSAGNSDIFVTKLDANGNLVWAKAMGNTSADTGYGISTDASGNVYTTGSFTGTADFDPNAGIFNLTSAGSSDIFVQKLDANGNLVWAIAMGSASFDYGYGISTDAAGNVYTTGYFTGTTDFDPNAGTFNLTSAGGYDIFVHKMGASGAALDFDGVNDNVSIGNAITTVLSGTNKLTVEAWVKTTNTTGIKTVISNHGNGSATQFDLRTNGVNFDCFVGYGTYVVTAGIVIPNTWQHVAMIFDGATLKLYVNGVNVGTTITPPYTLQASTATTIMGNNGYGEIFQGKMDEVRVWNRALSQAEIQNNMNCELSAGQTGLLAYYQFNQGVDNTNNSSTTTLTDSSGNANTGTLNNFTLTGATSNWGASGGVTTGNTCSAFLSTSDFEYSSKLVVYPNPSSDVFTINSDSRGTIVVYDLIGKIIKTENLDLGITKLDLSNYPSGLYLMKVTNDSNQTKTMKLIKQ